MTMTVQRSALALLAALPAIQAAPTLAERQDAPAACLPTSVPLPYGTVTGTTTSLPSATAAVNKFLGVPFAKSPPERFTPPSQPDQAAGPIDATAFKPACIQQFPGPAPIRNFTESVFNEPPPMESEDCLYLNVYAPSSPAPPGGRAVLFWIYGGGLEFGNAGTPPYDGSAFAAYQDVVLVAANYRTNVFGFPNSPELAATGQNLGFLDQRFALNWTQQNIDKFGGDPKKVTIFGESAGALSVDILLTSFTTETAPFRGAILESGQASYGDLGGVLGTTQNPFSQLAAALNCTPGQSNLTCVRNAPATTIQQIIDDDAFEFQPVVDNLTNYGSGALQRAAGHFAAVPVLGGSNYQEGRVFEVGQTNFSAFLQQTFGAVAPQQIPLVEAAYGPVGTISGVNTDYDLVSAVYTDLNFQCGQALQANQTAAAGVPAWRYLYNATFPSTTIFDGSGVYHSSEIVSVFQTYAGGPVNPNTPVPIGMQRTNLPPTAQQVALSRYMNGAWADFAKNPMGGPGWTEIGRFNESLGVLGVDGSSGVTVVDPYVVTYRCPLFYPLYEAAVNGVPLPGLDS